VSALDRARSNAPPLELFEGLEGLEEEPEEEEGEEEVEEEAAPEAPSIHSIVPKGGIGSGIAELQRLEVQFRATGEDPEIDEEALMELHAALIQDAPKCPSVNAVAWIVKTLEELAIEEDEILEVCAKILIERADELGPQAAMDVVCSYGNVYWANGDDLLDAFAGAVRRQLADFTQAEIVRLSNALIRMGGIDDAKYAGLFFEMRQRVNLPHVEEFIKMALNTNTEVNKKPSEQTLLGYKALEKMPNKRFKAKAEKMLQYDLEVAMPKLIDKAEAQQNLHDGWESTTVEHMGMLTGGSASSDKEKDEEGDSGPPEIRFQDLTASEAP